MKSFSVSTYPEASCMHDLTKVTSSIAAMPAGLEASGMPSPENFCGGVVAASATCLPTEG